MGTELFSQGRCSRMSGSAGAVSIRIAKPLLRGINAKETKRDLIASVIAGFVGMFAFKYAVCQPRIQQYAEFARNYDPYADFERMAAAGIFQTVNADGSVNQAEIDEIE